MNIALISRPEFLPVEGPPYPHPFQMQGSDAEQLIEFAGRNCYDSMGKGRGSAAFHANILEVGHGSVLEHANFSFLVTGVSRNLMAELTRHKIGHAYSIRSTRYVDEGNSPLAVHPLLENLLRDRDLAALWAVAHDAARDAYAATYAALLMQLIGMGVDEQTARKQARGAARGILPSALATSIVWTANIRALRHVIEMRASEAADAEIRMLGNAVLEIMNEEVPAYFSDYDLSVPKDGIGLAVHTEHEKV